MNKKLLLILLFCLITTSVQAGLTKGTNCGFVTSAPSADPTGDNTLTIDNRALAFKDTSPVDAAKIVEIGWWCNNATQAGNFDVGIYTHNVGDDNPEAKEGDFAADNAKGTDAGWKKVTGLNIAITAETIYWIAMQMDNVATATKIDYTSDAGEKTDYKVGQTALIDPWGASGGSQTYLSAVYAVWEEEGEPPAGVVKTYNGLAWASVKTIDGLAVGSVKTINGVAAQ